MHIKAIKQLLDALEQLGLEEYGGESEAEGEAEGKAEAEGEYDIKSPKIKKDVSIKIAKVKPEEMEEIKNDFMNMLNPKKAQPMKGLRLKA